MVFHCQVPLAEPASPCCVFLSSVQNVYKSDLEWMKGIGWLTEGSVEVTRVKNAQNLLNERLYRIKPEDYKFTSIVDTPEVILAKTNALQISEVSWCRCVSETKLNQGELGV